MTDVEALLRRTNSGRMSTITRTVLGHDVCNQASIEPLRSRAGTVQ